MSDIALDLEVLEAPQPPLVIEPCEFWMVWTKRGHAPRYFHNSYQSAETEVERLARLHPGQKFIILEAVSKRHLPAVAERPPVGEEAEGREAWEEAGTAAINPYVPGTHSFVDWQRGYAAAYAATLPA